MTFYTYAHLTPEGKVFYIGKGTKDRVYSTSDRSKNWRSLVKKHEGVRMQVLAYWDSEDEAFEHEKLLVECFKDFDFELANLTNGGRGVKGFIQSDETRAKRKEKMTGYKYKKVTCPKCGFVGGETSTKRWHFDNCKGLPRQFKARVTINGERIYLGKFATKQEADEAMEKYYREANVPIPRAFYKKSFGRSMPQLIV